MAHLTSGSVARQLGSLFESGSVIGLSDRQLLERFLAGRDAVGEAAFAALVSRYGPMVLGVCRQLLVDRHHAEDAFQAVFLVLAQKARSIRDPDLLGNWLYGVAIRTARCARQQLGRQRKNEGDWVKRLSSNIAAEPPAEAEVLAREQAEALYEEIERMPTAFRLPVVLCYLEGLTIHEAAQRLRWSHGTVRSRLARARDKLRRSLTRRGVVLPAAVMSAILDSKAASASISTPLCDITTRTAIEFMPGQAAARAISAAATALAREVLRTMLVTKLKVMVLALLFLGAVAAGAGFVAQAPGRQTGKPDLRERQAGTAELRQIAAKPDDVNTKPGPGRMFVTGRVLGPNGKPVPDATVAAYARNLALGRAPYKQGLGQVPIGDAHADGSGRFRIDAPRTSSSRHQAFGAIALAPGYGAGWVMLDPDDDQPTADITLRPEQVIHGRLLDLQGRPVPDVILTVASIRRLLSPEPASAPISRFGGVMYSFTQINDFPAWPKPATTDADGRYILRGLGRELGAVLTVHHPQFALQRIQVGAAGASEPKPVTTALIPAQVLTGRVTYADTGKGVPHAPLKVRASFARNITIPAEFEADGEGRFRLNPPPANGSYGVTAFPPDGQPYLIASKALVWPKGALEQSIDLALPRGVLIHGKVTEEGTGKPVAGATVDFVTRRRPNGELGNIVLDTAADGSFRLGAVPSPGYLFVKGPSDDYVLQAIDFGTVRQGRPGGPRIYSHAFRSLDLKPGIGSQEVDLVLRRGATVAGKVIGPDGRAVRDAWIFSRVILDPPSRGAWGTWSGYHGRVRNGRFEVRGLDPSSEDPAYLLEPKGKLGGVANLSVKSSAAGPITVRLEPCGAAKARFVDAGGKPVAGPLPGGMSLTMVVTPGPPPSTAKNQAGVIAADETDLSRIDTVNYETASRLGREIGLVPDSEGRLTLPVLIPGATYRFVDHTAVVRDETGPQLRKEFTVKPGETLDLGDILIEKPPR